MGRRWATERYEAPDPLQQGPPRGSGSESILHNQHPHTREKGSSGPPRTRAVPRGGSRPGTNESGSPKRALGPGTPARPEPRARPPPRRLTELRHRPDSPRAGRLELNHGTPSLSCAPPPPLRPAHTHRTPLPARRGWGSPADILSRAKPPAGPPLKAQSPIPEAGMGRGPLEEGGPVFGLWKCGCARLRSPS